MTTPSINARKGRAIAARPLLCLGVCVLFLLSLAPVAQAALRTPILTETNPESPGTSRTPVVKGTVDGPVTSVVTFGSAPLRPIAFGEGSDNIVTLYTSSTCAAGTEVGAGTVAELTGDGVQVTVAVAENVTTRFYAKQEDGSGDVSSCSQPLAYRHVSAAPGPPSFTGSNPPSPANENFPRLVGSADPDATVLIYANGSCSGSEPAASGSGAQFQGAGIQVAVTDNSQTSFSARARLAGYSSGCSAVPLTYQEVTPPADPTPPGGGDTGGGQPGGGGVSPGTPVEPPPAPRLRTVPGGSANDNEPRITGSAPGAGTVWVYASPNCGGTPVAKGSAAQFAAGISVHVVDNTAVTFSAISLAGATVSKCSDPVVYVEDSLSPRTRITMGPAAKTAKRKAVIRFTDTTGAAPGTRFLCKVDKAKWKPCSSPLRLKKLRPRRYVVRVKATDPAGNVEAKGAQRGFKVIRRP